MKKGKKIFHFSGYATKNDLKCSDGRTIRKDAFKDNDGQTVPLVWQHVHNDPSNVLGHAVLENRKDGVYTYGVFNNSPAGKNAKELVEHGDITMLSIFANQLVQKGDDVVHGMIREVSLVLAGANKGAVIDNLCFAHGDGTTDIDDSEAIIFTGLALQHGDDDEGDEGDGDGIDEGDEGDGDGDGDGLEHSDGQTIQQIFDTLTEEQKQVVYVMLAHAAETSGDSASHSFEGGNNNMKKNVFNKEGDPAAKSTLSHTQVKAIFDEAISTKASLKDVFLAHVQTYGIENIDILFPDAQTVTPTPDMIKRDTGWVGDVINGAKHTPFARIKSTAADITADEARAKGYVKGALKKEEVIKLLKRITGPTTIYKKQKLDRDDIIDITELDVVAFLKAEMRLMLDEELARAALIGDGRESDDEDKINEECIRPIWTDEDMYAHHVKIAAGDDLSDLVETIISSRTNYKGSGSPVFFTTSSVLTGVLLLKDGVQRRLYNNVSELASALMVSRIIEVPVMEGAQREIDAKDYALKGILVNMNDYTMGADKGGNVSMFDDFDIDYNQYKYLIETRCSGALVHPKSAIVFEQEIVAG